MCVNFNMMEQSFTWLQLADMCKNLTTCRTDICNLISKGAETYTVKGSSALNRMTPRRLSMIELKSSKLYEKQELPKQGEQSKHKKKQIQKQKSKKELQAFKSKKPAE